MARGANYYERLISCHRARTARPDLSFDHPLTWRSLVDYARLLIGDAWINY